MDGDAERARPARVPAAALAESGLTSKEIRAELAVREVASIVDDVHRWHDQGGWSQARYQRGIDKEVADHLRGRVRGPGDDLAIGSVSLL